MPTETNDAPNSKMVFCYQYNILLFEFNSSLHQISNESVLLTNEYENISYVNHVVTRSVAHFLVKINHIVAQLRLQICKHNKNRITRKLQV